jgi:fused signal recognition particle receptor
LKKLANEFEDRTKKDIYRKGLEKTRGSLWGRIKSVFAGSQTIGVEDLEKIEEILITADVGMACTERFVEELRRSLASGNTAPKEGLFVDLLRRQIADSLPASTEQGGLFLEKRPSETMRPRVILVVGVNGTGKTTTIGKLAARMKRTGQEVMIVAADTYRAAAIQQLRIWAERSEARFMGGEEGGDPAAAVHDALTAATAKGIDAVIIDTAGRLHTKQPLMRELEKIRRVAGKITEGAPHNVLLVLDATTGQNAMVQAREFVKAAGVNGIVMTKMDGTAKGGILIPVAGELNLPILYVGMGEGLEDLVPFDAEEYAKGLIG